MAICGVVTATHRSVVVDDSVEVIENGRFGFIGKQIWAEVDSFERKLDGGSYLLIAVESFECNHQYFIAFVYFKFSCCLFMLFTLSTIPKVVSR